MNRRAFTLVELLVVIAIIGLLSTVAVVALGSARASGRIARRNADIKQLHTAFSLPYINTGSYPAGTSCLSTTCGGGWAGVSASATIDTYFGLQTKPLDPLEGKRTVTGYTYNSAFTGTAPYDGYVFPSAPYLSWFNETPSNLENVCGPGRIWSSTTTQTQCFLQLNQ